MANKMLIDASHPEETRVVVTRGQRVEEFDFESASRKQLKGNIYLAKVTRVEPSLQAAFVDYGGNRHGFLAFSEIHPDYYQIPVADRQALIREEEEAQRYADDDALNGEPTEGGDRQTVENGADQEGQRDEAGGRGQDAELVNGPAEASDEDHSALGHDEEQYAARSSIEASQSEGDQEPLDSPRSEHGLPAEIGQGVESVEEDAETQKVESVGAEDALEEVPRARRPQRRSYKIQEVIKRRQV